eukprot:10099942-Alexandrium_andersonii.AAC.1
MFIMTKALNSLTEDAHDVGLGEDHALLPARLAALQALPRAEGGGDGAPVLGPGEVLDLQARRVLLAEVAVDGDRHLVRGDSRGSARLRAQPLLHDRE